MGDIDTKTAHYRRLGVRVMILRDMAGRPFLKRWRLIDTERCSVFLHRLYGPDPGLDLHDHPWPYATLVLSGGYEEEVAPARLASGWAALAEMFADCTTGLPLTWRWGSFHRGRVDVAHRITNVKRWTWTLVVTGRQYRSWGFYMPSTWVDWKRYDYAARRPCTEETS